MNNDRIADIRARCEAATSGPWYTDGWATWDDLENTFVELSEFSADAKFIAHSREDIPYLLEQIAKSEAEVERLRGLLAERNVLLDKQDEELATLREAQQKKGCEYCLEVSLEDCKSWEIWGGKSVDIRFCPMCGRRLEEPHDKR